MERNGMYTRVIIILEISLIQPVFPKSCTCNPIAPLRADKFIREIPRSLIQSFIISQEGALIS